MDRKKLIEQMSKIDWMHTIDLGGGLVTPGKWPVNQYILAAFDSIDFRDKKVLDIGTCNGIWSFEAEKRGASEVHSIDYLSQVGYWCTPGYELAHTALGSRAQYNPDVSVYEIEEIGVTDFDVIIFCGVYYHLKNPLLALAKLRKVLKTGGSIIVEGPIILNDTGCYARFLYHDAENDPSNWWIPTRRCLAEWLESSFFRVTDTFEQTNNDVGSDFSRRARGFVRRAMGKERVLTQRTVVLAEGITRKSRLDAALDDLAPFASS